MKNNALFGSGFSQKVTNAAESRTILRKEVNDDFCRKSSHPKNFTCTHFFIEYKKKKHVENFTMRNGHSEIS